MSEVIFFPGILFDITNEVYWCLMSNYSGIKDLVQNVDYNFPTVVK